MSPIRRVVGWWWCPLARRTAHDSGQCSSHVRARPWPHPRSAPLKQCRPAARTQLCRYTAGIAAALKLPDDLLRPTQEVAHRAPTVARAVLVRSHTLSWITRVCRSPGTFGPIAPQFWRRLTRLALLLEEANVLQCFSHCGDTHVGTWSIKRLSSRANETFAPARRGTSTRPAKRCRAPGLPMVGTILRK